MNTPSFTSWFQTETLWGLSLVSLALALAAALGAYLAMSLLLGVAVRRARRLAEAQGGSHRTAGVVYELLAGTSRLLVFVAAVLVGVGMLDLPGRWAARVGQLWFLALALQVGLWGTRAVALGIARYRMHHGLAAAGDAAPFSASATLLLAMLSNLGVNITAFVASLGVGGIAVALAVQSILGDLFASLAIAVDKPFDAGDFIVVGGVAGTVQRIGLKTTRIRSLGGEQVVMSNTDLLKQTINNYRYLQERRIVFQFRVPYGTTAEQAEAVPQAVRRIIEAEGQARFDRAHLQGFVENGLQYEVVYIVLDPAYNVYMDLQQRINLSLMRELATLGVDFAVPARTVQLAAPAGGPPPGGFLRVQQPATA
ncbi:mechanosensitive ion channel family protein [Acidovorax sp. SUPP3434]|uniref:mechanosensitive ion channel family protein n=1 Tax=Acidovorax sp. SUPP3434 TaxID=2920880 RepID=UPI0023DE64A3|nr:mechanosensitive ion channel family protein [Acidovorax sp. SUPP3434]GKT01874.1 mechanosensitive ion channel family protein [Acidovorax sp. SUPP3434]